MELLGRHGRKACAWLLQKSFRILRKFARGQLLRREGLSAEAKEAETLSMSKPFALEIKGVALICLCFLEHATPAQLHYATRRLRRKAPGVSILASVFDETRQTPDSDPLQLQDAEFLQGPLSAGVRRVFELISLPERRIENDQRPALATVKMSL
jgi:hypothetical protein